MVGIAVLVLRSLIGAATVWLLPVAVVVRAEAAVVFTATAVVALATLAVPWARAPRILLAIYPVVGMGSLATIGVWTTGVGPTYVGFIVFSFMFVGFTGSVRGVLALVPVAAGTWLLMNGVAHTGMTASLGIRLTIGGSVWAAVGLLLARQVTRDSRERSVLTDDAHTDALTGLGNRRVLPGVLDSLRPGDVVVAVDIDQFRELNTSRGHSGGDTVLAEFGRTVRLGLRGGDHAIRPGGDEFVLALSAVSEVQVLSVLGRLRDRWQHECGTVTFSAGAAAVRPGETGRDTLLRADRHCYEAKTAGRDQWILDDPTETDTVDAVPEPLLAGAATTAATAGAPAPSQRQPDRPISRS